jgi:D-sedoheptulose 7-phosphate isomerase
MSPHIQQTLADARSALDALMANEDTCSAIDEAGTLLADLFERGGRVFSCGNGGSMCDAMHFAEELSGRYRGNRRALAAVAISDAGYMSCVANDYGYEHVFSRYLEAHARSGDVLVAISTSGTSGNVLAAVRAARQSA